MDELNAEHKTIAIWGLGREGKAAFEKRNTLFPSLKKLILIDEATKELPEWAVSSDQVLEISLHSPEILTSIPIDLLVRSAGVSPYKSEIQEFKNQGGTVKSISTLWFEQNPTAKTICITGTKGKSTTSKLVWHLLKEAGYNVALGGNIGVPLLELPKDTDWYVIEMSSYQCCDFNGQPTMTVVLNLFEDHISWHGSARQYHLDKLNLLRNAKNSYITEQVHQHEAASDLSQVDLLEKLTQWKIKEFQLS